MGQVGIGLVTIISFRPFPVDALRTALAGARDVVVVEKSVAVGMGGQLADNVGAAIRNLPRAPRLHSAVAGLGGRPISRASLHHLFRQATVQPWEGTHFLDLKEKVVGREISMTVEKSPPHPCDAMTMRSQPRVTVAMMPS